MMPRSFSYGFSFALLLSIAATRADAQSVTGKWTAMFDSDISRSKDTFVVKTRRPATLTLTQHGDSVTGAWSAGNLESVNVRGTFDGHTLRLTTGLNEREVRINGKAQRMKVRTVWMGSLQASGLSGTMFIYIGENEPPPRRWEATKG